MSNISTLYTSIMRLISYLKGYTVDIIDQQLFEEIRDNFPTEYEYACVFYNSSNVNELLTCTTDILKAQLSSIITEENKELLKNQYESLLRTVEKSYDNINTDVIINIVKTIGEEELNAQKEQLKLLIKSIIMTQVFTNMIDIIDTTIEQNGSYNYITDYTDNSKSTIVEHINDCSSLLNIGMNNINYYYDLLYPISESEANDLGIKQDQEEYFETGFLGEDEYTENDLNSITDVTIMHGNTRLDEFIFQMLYKNAMSIKYIVNKITEYDQFILLPNHNYLMFWILILMMHITANY